jgi:ABC-type ATPase with predicted acetyltransferase domain
VSYLQADPPVIFLRRKFPAEKSRRAFENQVKYPEEVFEPFFSPENSVSGKMNEKTF